VKRHAALPDVEDLNRTLNIAAKIIEQDISQPPPHHDAQDEKEQQVVEVVCRQRQFLHLHEALEQEVARDERKHIHQSVPAELYRTDSQKNRINVWKL